jgi:serine protease Do
MKENKRERGFAAAIFCLCLIAALSLAVGVLGFAFGGARFVPVGQLPEPGAAAKASNTWDGGVELEPGQIYTVAVSQTVTVEAVQDVDVGYAHVYGAGFIITYDGYVMTNCHVVSDAMQEQLELQVRTFEGDVYPAEVIGADTESDIALLKLEGTFQYPARLGNSDRLRPCDSVYIMGHPATELAFTMTAGIISALDRSITFSDGTTLDMFQLDAAVNFGNSGGPVYNRQGEVVGITTAKYTGLASEGLGFAIPINDAVRIAEDLQQYGFVRGRPLMGLTVRNVTENELGNANPEGVLVHAVVPGICGDKAGFKTGDVIVSLNGREVRTTAQLAEAKRPYKAGDTVAVQVWRDGFIISLELTFDEVTPEHPTGSVNLDEEEPEETEPPLEGDGEPGEEPGESED